MPSDSHEIVTQVYAAKKDNKAADSFIEAYMPFIRSETAKFTGRQPSQSDDELSIAMFAFYEAIRSYSRFKGAFLKYASVNIKRRLIDNSRRERRKLGVVSLDQPAGDNEGSSVLSEIIEDKGRPYDELEEREAVHQELAELTERLSVLGITLSDAAENSPHQKRTLEACRKAVDFARSEPGIIEDFLRTRRIPLSAIAQATGESRKTLERHRRYLAVVLLIFSGGFETIQEHIIQTLKGGAER